MASGDGGGHRIDVETQLGMDFVRPDTHELRRDAMQEVAQLEDHLVLFDLRFRRLCVRLYLR